MGPRYQGPHLLDGALQNDLNRAVFQVARPAPDSPVPRLLPQADPVAHALYAAVDDQVRGYLVRAPRPQPAAIRISSIAIASISSIASGFTRLETSQARCQHGSSVQ